MNANAKWRATCLGDLLTVRHGKNQRDVEVDSSPYPILATGGQIGWARHPLYSKPSVLIGRKGTIDKPQYQTQPFWTVDTLFYTEISSEADPRYLYYFFKTVDWRSMNESSGVPSLNASRIEGVELGIPKLAEQVMIRNVLDDSSRLIATLECLITKKEAIKQGMIQQLLTGRTRLPGFADEWREVRLRDVGSTYGGLVGKNKDDFGVGTATFVTFMEVMSNPKLVGSRLERVKVRAGENQNRVERGDVLFNGSSETPEEVALAAMVDFTPSSTTYLNSFCFGYRLNHADQIDPMYLAQFFRSQDGRALVFTLAQGATRYNISKTKLLELRLLLPSIDEQRALVEVLSDLDNELDRLNVRLKKSHAIKVGMMQQLLTGRTRLPVEVES